MKTWILAGIIVVIASATSAQEVMSTQCMLAVDAAMQAAKAEHERRQKMPREDKVEFRDMILKNYGSVSCDTVADGYRVNLRIPNYMSTAVIGGRSVAMPPAGGTYLYDIAPDYTIRYAAPQR